MNFGDAITLLKAGHKLQREGWNGVGMWVEMQNPDANSKMTLPYLYLNYPDGRTVPWLASQTDMLMDDWAQYKEPDMTKVIKAVQVLSQQAKKKPHWTQTPEGKKKMAARKRRGTKK